MAKLGTIELRILDLDEAKRLFAAAEDRVEKLEAVQEAGKELRDAYAATFRAIDRLYATPQQDITDLMTAEFSAAGIPNGSGKRFDDAVAAAIELVVEPDDGRRFVSDGRGGAIEISQHEDLTDDQDPE